MYEVNCFSACWKGWRRCDLKVTSTWCFIQEYTLYASENVFSQCIKYILFSLCKYSKLSWEAMMSQLLLNLHRYDKDGKPVSLIPKVG